MRGGCYLKMSNIRYNVTLTFILLFLTGCSIPLTTARLENPELGLTRELGYQIQKSLSEYYDLRLNSYPTLELWIGDYKAEFEGIKSEVLLKQVEVLENKGEIYGVCKKKLYDAAKKMGDTCVIRINEPIRRVVKLDQEYFSYQSNYGAKVYATKLVPQKIRIFIPGVVITRSAYSKEVNIHCGAMVLMDIVSSGKENMAISIDFDSLNYLPKGSFPPEFEQRMKSKMTLN